MAFHYANKPSQLPLSCWWLATRKAALRLADEDFSLQCAGVAFYALMSLFPAIALSVTLYGLVIDVATLQTHLDTARPFLPAQVYDIVAARLEDLVGSSETALGVGLLIALAIVLWSSSRGTNSLICVIGNAYCEPNERSFLRSAFVSISITLGAILFASAAFFVIAAIPVLLKLLPLLAETEILVRLASWPAMACFSIAGIALLYRLAPNRRDARWIWILPGAAVTAVLWLVGSVAFSLYVENFGNYDATFGSIATIVVVMLWLYYSVLIVAFGAALNGQLELSTRQDSTVGPNRPMGERGAFAADNVRGAR